MTAKQTWLSASLVLVCASSSEALADPDVDIGPEPADQAPPPPSDGKTGSFEIGAGYGTDEGFLAIARIAQANLFRTGKQLSMTTLVSARRQEFLVRYDDPALFGSQTLRLRGDLYSRTKLYQGSGFQRDATGGALTLVDRIAPNLDVFVGYKIEEIEVTPTDASTLYRGTVAEPFWRGGTIAALRAGIDYSNVGREVYPRRGTTVGASIEVADRQLGSDLDYTRTDAWFAHHQPIGPLTLHLGMRASSISDTVPISERLHFDGSSDIRGYAPGSLMPEGGNFMWTARAELEAPLIRAIDLDVAGFVDAGGMYRQGVGAEGASTGFGVIWRSPIGPLRVDVAFPLNGDGQPRYLIGIGGVF